MCQLWASQVVPLRVGHDWATSLSLFTFMHWRRKWQPLQYSCLENPRDGVAWWAAVYGVAQSWTWLKQLSSSSSSSRWYSEKAMAPHSSTLAWKIPWMEEPGKLQSMGLLRVRHDWAISLSLFTFMHWRRKWQPLQYSCPENPRDGGAWWASVYEVTQSRTQLEWLSSSSSRVK